MLPLTGRFAANAALLFWQRKRTRVSFFFEKPFTSGCGTLSVAISGGEWLHRSRAPLVGATRWVSVQEVNPTGYTSRPLRRWLQPRSPICNSFKPTTSCSCRPSRVSHCSQVAYIYIFYQFRSLVWDHVKLHNGLKIVEVLQSCRNGSFRAVKRSPYFSWTSHVPLNTVHFLFGH